MKPLEEKARGRVVVAMSGGVDSSFVAADLHAKGWDVVGVSMRLYATPDGEPGKSCCSPDDLHDARAVAAQCGFPYYVANYQEAFRERVIDYFVDEYRRGRTPSPCVLCNDHLKFDVLLERMEALGGRFLVTGHYARIEEREHGWALLRGVDRTKDQSYFLFGLRREVLQRIRFPLGEMTKAQVRAGAETLGLMTATKAESQDICFVGGGDYAEFVEARLRAEEIRRGEIVRESTGEVLGSHDGIHRFTIGQRRGIGVSYPEPLYVRGVDPETGNLLVGTVDELGARRFRVHRVNWLRWETPPATFPATVQVRYRHRGASGTVNVDADAHDQVTVTLDAPERAIAPGQAAVFYDGDEVVGGGWIEALA